jgi:hypothetical protein
MIERKPKRSSLIAFAISDGVRTESILIASIIGPTPKAIH